MVKTLHAAGIEVILDVVYNHTAEGNQLGADAVLSRRRQRRVLPAGGGSALLHGLHRHRQYRDDDASDRATADDGTACATGSPRCTSTAFASISPRRSRARRTTSTRPAPFSTSCGRTRCCPPVKLIAEPWDLGENGYQVGGFPPGWAEWNGRYRDNIRSYWKGDGGTMGDTAARLSGSSDIFEPSGRGPTASINFITAHDGFTLH